MKFNSLVGVRISDSPSSSIGHPFIFIFIFKIIILIDEIIQFFLVRKFIIGDFVKDVSKVDGAVVVDKEVV